MKNNKGFIAMTTILIVSAVVLGIATTVALVSIGEGQASLSLTKGEDALQFVEGCAEDALLKIRASASYTGGTITRPEGTCSVTIVAGSPNTATVTTQDTKYKRTVVINYTRSSSGVTITSWKES